MSRILCVIDGMTDSAFSAADYPNLSSMRLSGYKDTCKNSKPESLNCILHLLGVDKVPPYLRGYTEAVAEGIRVKKDDLVFRGSWFSLDEDDRCVKPVAGPEEFSALDGVFRYHVIDGYKTLLVFPGKAHLIDTIKTFPPYSCSGTHIADHKPEGCREVELCFSLSRTDERALILRGESVPSKLSPFPEKAAVICGTSVVKGIAKLLQMDLIEEDVFTGDIDTDLKAKASAALKAANKYPFVFLHVNGADEAAHRCDPPEKHQFLRKIDSEILPLLLESGHEIILMGDHGTDPESGMHTGNKQPCFTSYKVSAT